MNKMSEDTRMSNAGIPLVLGEHTFQAYSFSDRDYDELTEFVRQEFLREAVKASRNFDPETRKELRAVALKETVSITWNSETGSKILDTVVGVQRVAWQMTKKEHKFPFSKFVTMFEMTKENIDEIYLVYARASGYVDEPEVQEYLRERERGNKSSGN